MTLSMTLALFQDDAAPLRLVCGAATSTSRGRAFPEPPSPTRTPFQRDRDRIIHCGAFRRLALKTQVFLPEEGDHYRTRLTHTIEVAQIARSMARVLGLDEDLTEALALAHDLGHAPFGHTGEDALDAVLREAGGFDHNVQTLRIVTELERRYPGFDGLNLTAETLEGLVKRNGPLLDPDGAPRRPVPPEFSTLADGFGFDLRVWPGAEAQVAAVADDIAYNAHDLEDGLDAGLFDLAELAAVPPLADLLAAARVVGPGLDRDLDIRALARAMVGVFVEDAIAASRPRLERAGAGVGRANEAAVVSSPPFEAASRAVKAFLRARMYSHPRLLGVRARAYDITADLAAHLLARPQDLPEPCRGGDGGVARRVRDYVAGLTDRGAVREHRRLFPSTPDLL